MKVNLVEEMLFHKCRHGLPGFMVAMMVDTTASAESETVAIATCSILHNIDHILCVDGYTSFQLVHSFTPVHTYIFQIGVSLAVHVPIYLNYIVIAVWFFCHAAMELTLIIFTGSSIKSHVSI
jgi:hypothetical protein